MLHGRRLHVRMLHERRLYRNSMRSHWSEIISARLQLMRHRRRLHHTFAVLHHGHDYRVRRVWGGQKSCAKDGRNDEAWAREGDDEWSFPSTGRSIPTIRPSTGHSYTPNIRQYYIGEKTAFLEADALHQVFVPYVPRVLATRIICTSRNTVRNSRALSDPSRLSPPS